MPTNPGLSSYCVESAFHHPRLPHPPGSFRAFQPSLLSFFQLPLHDVFFTLTPPFPSYFPERCGRTELHALLYIHFSFVTISFRRLTGPVLVTAYIGARIRPRLETTHRWQVRQEEIYFFFLDLSPPSPLQFALAFTTSCTPRASYAISASPRTTTTPSLARALATL